ncbi:uncharacterized protein LOC129945091 [Eupeodes corollae]|uniref:uncharacterized protein LOC129945091 n=1 Tax=Eupeodes corollae TaxID=290404 RepID=UPI0024925D97|nr:uncharacterized protein LOC129945091 [Eupeodes corollae]
MDEILVLSKGNAIKRLSPIYKLSPYLDYNGLLRLSGRVALENRDDPIILPKYHHCNNETVVNEVRQKYWIPRLRVILHKTRRDHCQYCKNQSARPSPPKMSCLPQTRLASYCRPFTYAGVDYFGPLPVSVRRSSEKEVAYSLSTDSCIMAIRNFMARRGSPVELWSDNGTNFKGAERELREAFELVDKNKITSAFTSSSMKWRFIPPSSPHMGGAWERLVRSVKDVLYKILPSRNPNDELLRSSLMDVEMIVNSRPLTYIPIDHEEEESLTPNHFLLGSSSGIKPIIEGVSEGVQLRRNWQTAQQLANSFWKRWLREYLPVITRRCKWFDEVKPIEVDDIVLIVDPDSPRFCWPKGSIIATKVGADGRVRSALVKTVAGIFERPATKIAVLDVRWLKERDVVGPQEDILGGSVATDLATPLPNIQTHPNPPVNQYFNSINVTHEAN